MAGHTVLKSMIMCICVLIAGCAMVMPTRNLDEVTPIDWGLENSFENGVTIMPFDAQDEKWGNYAARQMKQHLLETGAFRRVVLSEKDKTATDYVLKGEIEHIFYGGTHSPSKVCVTVRIFEVKDGKTRFLRVSRATSEKDAFHMTWLSRVYVPSPYPEELLNALLKHIAEDISQRTLLVAKKCP